MPRPLVATIDVDAMRHNLSVAKQHAPGAKAWAVVKANAYGHGLLRAMAGFEAADGLALIEFDNAVQLREAGWTKPLLMLEGCFDAADMQAVIDHGLETVVHCDEQIAWLEEARPAAPIRVHLKLNSGMNRLGFKPEAFRRAYLRLRSLNAVAGITLVTHFANADDPSNLRLPLAAQLQCFREAAQGLDAEWSLANSAADLLDVPLLKRGWIRPGIMLYGGAPGSQAAGAFGLLPAMSLTSQVIGIQTVAAGEAVGYGSRFVAHGPMRIAIVACGYADGYPRHAPNGAPILIDDVKTQVVGRVSMDMLMADVTRIPSARIGSSVTLWGAGLPIDDVARAAGTIGYELMCALTARVRMVERA